ncbi:MAG: thiol:disulfide interchange protein DsbC [Paraglaciecola psychrophila]|jgi:thiol:disulfide interchange protein DsbC
MKQIVNSALAVLCLLGSQWATAAVTAQANAQLEVPSSVTRAIRSNFAQSRPDIELESISASAVKGIFEVKVSGGPVLYTSADGKHFIIGDMYAAAVNGFVNLAEQAREGDRAQLMASVKSEDMIIFSPQQLPAKATVMVFTDVDCFYCQKLHNEVPDLNRIGIEVRYLAYPRAGVGSDSYNKIASAWCSADKQASLTRLKNRQSVPTNVCADNPVASQFDLGKQVGVNGTPALVTPQGQLFPGYMPALRLASVLGVEVDPIIAAQLQRKEDAQAKK